MKIAIFTNNYLPNPFGVSMSIESFRNELEKCGHTVYIFAPKFKDYVDNNLNVFRFPSIEFSFSGVHFPLVIPYSYKISRILEKLEIDIIHSQHPNLLGWKARKWAKKKNVPLVFTWHTLYDKYAHFAPMIPDKLAAWWTIRNAVKYANKADAIIAPSPSMKKIILNWGAENSNIAVISTGVDENTFKISDREKTRKEMGILEKEKVLLLVSRLTKEKNVLFLAEAAAKILKKNKTVKFIIAGSGSEKLKMQEIFTQNETSGQVFFLGVANRKEIANVFSVGDIFLCASKSETQGMIISEAMLMGLPVVAVGATGVKDFIVNYATGFLVKENIEDFSNAVQRILDDDTLRLTFSQKAAKIAREEYTSEISTKKMLKIYQESINRKKVK